MSPNAPMQIAAVLGSLREPSYTAAALRAAVRCLEATGRVQVDWIDPRDFPMAFPGEARAMLLEAALAPRIAAADGILLATPEYHGSYSSVMKTLIDSMGYPSALAGKPVALLGVASGRLGAVKAIEHLRGVCAHAGAVVLPLAVSLACVEALVDLTGDACEAEVELQLQSLAGQLVRVIHQWRAGEAAVAQAGGMPALKSEETQTAP